MMSMFAKIEVKPNTYYDSVTLMTLSARLKKEPGVLNAVLSMGTDMNKAQLRTVSLSNEETDSAGANDLILAIAAVDEESANRAHAITFSLLTPPKSEHAEAHREYPSLALAKKEQAGANFAIISVMGAYAAREARIALEAGLHVMLFSDNVSLAEEGELKALAHKKNLLLMGPDCGTAILGGYGLCFANAVRRGNIGIVAASGTGLQEVSVQIDRLGEGISEAIGTGGRDLSADIGGIMTLDGIRRLEEDPETKVIVLISKPPVAAVAEKIIARLQHCKTPVVVSILGGQKARDGLLYAASLEEAARLAVKALRRDVAMRGEKARPLPDEDIIRAKAALTEGQCYLRALFCGGTLASEALGILARQTDRYVSNVAKDPAHQPGDTARSEKHCILDLGDDAFTVGRPHPMIEPTLRIERLLQEAEDPETAVILLDFVLGYGAHPDPVGVTEEALTAIRSKAPEIAIVAYVLGTESDPQGLMRSRQQLQKLGVIVAESNREAADIAVSIAMSKGGL